MELSTPALSYFEGGDPNSTNLFVANLSSKVTENHLMLEFGAYGPLASVKIMWPRGMIQNILILLSNANRINYYVYRVIHNFFDI